MVEVKGPIAGYYYPHKAILVELKNLEKMSTELSLDSTNEVEEFKKRIDFLKQFFDAHEAGEEAALYPAAGRLRKDVDKTFEWDRHISEECFQTILGAIDEFKKNRQQSALLNIMKGTAALKAFLGAHETKEDEILLPLLDAELDPKEQGQVIGTAMSKFPASTVEDVEKFLIRRLTQEERMNFLRTVKPGAPPDVFKAIIEWVKEVLSEEEWRELEVKIPELVKP